MNNSSIKRNEKIFEALLSVAAAEVMEEEMAALPGLEKLNEMYVASETLDKKIKGIIKKESRTHRRKQGIKTFGRVAAILGLIFTVSTIALMSVEASRNFIINILFNMRNDHVVFDFGDDTTPRPNEYENNHNFLNYLPVGFYYLTSHATERSRTFVYINDAGQQITITQREATSVRVGMDTDYREFSVIYLGNQEVYFFEGDGEEYQHVMMWTDSNIVYTILTNIDIYQFFEITERLVTR